MKNKNDWFFFCKNCLTLFVSGREKKAHFRAHYLFWPKSFFGPKQCKPGKTIKIVVSAEIGQNTKMTPFFGKKCFLTWVKKWVLLTVFLKSCVFSENTILIVFSAKPSFSKAKNCMMKKAENL